MDFKRALVKTRPTVQLLAPVDSTLVSINRDNEDSDCEMTTVPRPIKRKASDGRLGSAKPAETPASKPTGYYTHHFDAFSSPARMFTWEEIHEINEDSRRAGLPDQTDPKAIEIMNQLSVEHWDKPMDVFLNITHRLIRDMLMGQLEDVFIQYYQTSLFRELKRIIDVYLQSLKQQHVEHATENYNIEKHKPFTMSISALDQSTKAAYNYLSTRRHEARANNYLDIQGRLPPGDPRREAEIRRLTHVELGVDIFAQQLRMMATTRGYYEVASSRFVDSICQSVHTKLFTKCREDLIHVIEKELKIFDYNALDRCMELMAEDPERQRRRQYLLREKEKINKAQGWLATAKKDDDAMENTEPLFVPFVKTRPRDDWDLSRVPPAVG